MENTIIANPKKRYYRNVKKITHMSINVDGILRQHARTKKINFCDEDDGSPMNPAKAYQLFQKYQYEGKRVVSMSDECYRFDYQKGCKGHIVSLNPSNEKLQEIEMEYQKTKQ